MAATAAGAPALPDRGRGALDIAGKARLLPRIDYSAPFAAEGEKAKLINAAMPASSVPVIPAGRFVLPWTNPDGSLRALDCLAAAVYYEAATEATEGQQAVAQVVLNRMRHPAFPKTVCGVVFEGSHRRTGCQFTFTCDGSLARVPSASGLAKARLVARAALSGYVAPSVGLATHYHTDWVLPYWAPKLVKIGQLGSHIFYRWPGGWGQPGAFRSRYAGLEHERLDGTAGLPIVLAGAGQPETVAGGLAPLPVQLGSPLDGAAPVEADQAPGTFRVSTLRLSEDKPGTGPCPAGTACHRPAFSGGPGEALP